ncbi:MAG: Spore coat protein CotH, partial [Verrucomicrobiales bacterium]|nr:Spore coat protein CotH [Verrucomicrobiales bacterium]
RVPNGTGQWTLNIPTLDSLNSAAGLASSVNLHINEWMANSADGNDWFELFNSATQPVDMSGLFLSDKLDVRNKSQITPLSFIGTGPGAFIKFEADSNPGAGAKHADFKLSAKGDSIGLFRADGSVISSVTFGLQSLDISQGYLPDGSQNLASFVGTSSPGESNYLPTPGIIVNEVLTHTDPPLEDAIEFYNIGNGAVDLSGWFISNSSDNLKKFQIPAGTTIAARGYKVFYQNQFDSDTNSLASFTFNSAHGDQVYLSATDANGNLTGYRTHEQFGAAAHGVSFGQVPTSIGFKFAPLSRTTFGADSAATLEQFRTGTGLSNAPARIGPIVINEIMYRPLTTGATNATENPDEEFIELQNITGTAVPLFDQTAPTNTWKLDNAVNYTFPANQTIAAGEYVLVVDFDSVGEPQLAQNFRTKYGVPSNVRIYGPYQGRLSNSSDTIELLRPDKAQEPPHPDAGFVPYVQVDAVSYLAASPWPITVAGASLQKLTNGLFGDDPASWFAAAPTAGRQNQSGSGPTDTDHDGIPDSWEIAYGLNPNDSADAALDPDHDGLTNLQEYLAGTDPLNTTSSLALQAQDQADGIHLSFNAVAGKHYNVEFKNSLEDAAWQILNDVPAPSQSGLITLRDSIVENHRFYRVKLSQ